ncbi:MAG: M28 family peptidase [Solirubrobacteraceae bacterium]|nr:M28 family peptidase [Solirubrobacteraceae bacterium]
MNAAQTPHAYEAGQAELALMRELIEQHAALDRPAGGTGEFRSAQLLRDRLADAGTNARIEAASFYQGWPSALAIALSVPIAAGFVGPTRGRKVLALASVAAGAMVADDIDNRTRILRRLLRRQRPTTNVIAEVGPADAPVTLVVLAHHDAGRTGAMFDQTLQKKLWQRFPERVESMDTSLPYWWPAFLAPVVVAAGLLTGSRKLRRSGAVVSSLAFGLLVDIMRSPTVPGANDNLSGVAVLVALAERLRERPIDDVRVILVSAGAEEELQGGVYDYLRDHGAELDPTSTYCLAVDTVGSPQLVMLEGEGTVAMEDYADPSFRDLVADVAAEHGVSLDRGLRSRFSTDGVVFSRANIPTVCLVSLEPWKAPANYHLMTDTPENLTYETIAATTELCERVAQRLAADRV